MDRSKDKEKINIIQRIANNDNKKVYEYVKNQETIEEEGISQIIRKIAGEEASTINYKEIMIYIKNKYSNINWIGVYEMLDQEDLKIRNWDSFIALIECWTFINGENTFPFSLFFKKMKNEEAQLSFLTFLIQSELNEEVRLPFKLGYMICSNVFLTRIASVEDFNSKNFYKSPWFKGIDSVFNCVELFKCLSTINNIELIEAIKSKAPEWCVLGLSVIYPRFEELLDELVLNVLKGEKNSNQTLYNYIIPIIFKQNPFLIIQKMAKSTEEGVSLSKCLDIALEYKMLPFICDSLNPPYFCFEILILSSRRDHLNLNIWLSNMFSQRKDSFVNSYMLYLIEKFKKVDKLELDSLQIFPLTLEISISTIQTLEILSKSFNKDSLSLFSKLKGMLPLEVRNITQRKTGLEQQSNEFISHIINAQKNVYEGVTTLSKFIKGSVYEKELSLKIFSTLIENYHNFFRLPNSEVISTFYGKLIEKKIFTNFYLKKAMNTILNSLKTNQRGREYNFALKCLQNFTSILNEFPEYLEEIEKIESVKEIIVEKEETYFFEENEEKGEEVRGPDFLDKIFLNTDKPGEKIKRLLEILNEGNVEMIAQETAVMLSSKSEFNSKDNLIRNFTEVHINEIQNHILYVRFFNSLGNSFAKYFLERAFCVLEAILNNKLEKNFEKKISKNLGTFIGKLTILQNKLFKLETFNLKSFIFLCVEKKKYSFCIYFTVRLLKQAKYSLIFKPNNPWVMSILGLLSEIYYGTTATLKSEIENLFMELNVPIKSSKNLLRSRDRKVMYLAEYILDAYDSNLKHVICMGIDFSIREIASAITERICAIAIRSGVGLLNMFYCERNELVYLKNIIVNLVKGLSHVSSHEPIKASISGNVSFFVRTANLELETEKIMNIAADNVELCCKVIEKAGVTKIMDSFNEIIQEYKREPLHKHKTNSSQYYLPIISKIEDYDRAEIKTITTSEYQEIKACLEEIGKKMPDKKISIVKKEWSGLIKLIESKEDCSGGVERVLDLIESSESKDEMAESLCQYLVGYLLKTSNKRVHNVLFYMLKKIFVISLKTAREVISWIIYSEDERKTDIELISCFLKWKLINTSEFDQHLAKTLTKKINFEKNLKFILNLLNRAIAGDVKLCTPYDFVFTIETLSKINEEKYDDRIFELLKKISEMMMNNEDAMMASVFDEYVKITKFCTCPEHFLNPFLAIFNSKCTDISPFIMAAFQVSWDNFIRYYKTPSTFCYFKIDTLPGLLSNLEIKKALKCSAEVFYKSVEKKNYLFQNLYLRFLTLFISYIEEDEILFSLIDLLIPRRIPSFTISFIELCLEPRVLKMCFETDPKKGFFVCKELIYSLRYSDVHFKNVEIVVNFFMLLREKYSNFFNSNSLYFSFLCKRKFVFLKNLFNQKRSQKIEKVSFNAKSYRNAYFSIYNYVSSAVKESSYLEILNLPKNDKERRFVINSLVDNLNDKNESSMNCLAVIKKLVEQKDWTDGLLNLIVERGMVDNKPECLKMAFDWVFEVYVFDGNRFRFKINK